jgi:hypothetical protein
LKKTLLVALGIFSLFVQTNASFAVGNEVELISAETIDLQDGGLLTIFRLPDGSVMKIPSNLSSETLLTLTSKEIENIGLPPKPLDTAELTTWLEMYSTSNQIVPDSNIELTNSATEFAYMYSGNWGGYLAGTSLVQNTSYVAVKANFKVPLVSESCLVSPNYIVGAWVGLGGTNNGADDLVQQGIGWCNPNQSINKFTPWTEFAGTQDPFAFCNYSSWNFNTGDIIYNNMSYQSSTDTAYFYMQNQTTGVAHSCSRTAPNGWKFNGNTAECIVERPTGVYLANYGSLRVTNCQVELGSNSTWYPIGQRSSVKEVLNGYTPPGVLYQDTGPLGNDDKSFTMTFLHR